MDNKNIPIYRETRSILEVAMCSGLMFCEFLFLLYAKYLSPYEPYFTKAYDDADALFALLVLLSGASFAFGLPKILLGKVNDGAWLLAISGAVLSTIGSFWFNNDKPVVLLGIIIGVAGLFLHYVSKKRKDPLGIRKDEDN